MPWREIGSLNLWTANRLSDGPEECANCGGKLEDGSNFALEFVNEAGEVTQTLVFCEQGCAQGFVVLGQETGEATCPPRVRARTRASGASRSP